jgi:Tol biopolymer transport system component
MPNFNKQINMKRRINVIILFVALLIISCGQNDKKVRTKVAGNSPEGVILFESRPIVPSRYFDIGTIRSDGTNITMLTTHEEMDSINNVDACFSPDGNKIVFCIDSGKVSLSLSELYVMDAFDTDLDGKGDNLYTLTDLNEQAYNASWVEMDSGSKIGFVNETELGFRFSVIYLNNEMLIDSICPVTDFKTNDWEHVFSPDGMKVAFTRRIYTKESEKTCDAIYTIDKDGTNEKRLTLQDGSFSMIPCWSNDGNYIVYSSNKVDDIKFDLYIMDAKEGENDEESNRRLTLYGNNNFFPVFSPDNNFIAFSSDRAGSMDIYIMPITGETESVQAIKIAGIASDDEFPADWVIYE